MHKEQKWRKWKVGDRGARRRLGYSPETINKKAGNSTLNDIFLFEELIGVPAKREKRKTTIFPESLNPPFFFPGE